MVCIHQRRIAVIFYGLICGILLLNSSVSGKVIYVAPNTQPGAKNGTSWRKAFPELQSALNVAVSGDEIWVAADTYKPDYDVVSETHTGDRNASFQPKDGVNIYGGFPIDGGDGTFQARDPAMYETILSGDLAGDDVADLPNALPCYGDAPLEDGCDVYDLDSDGDVDESDLSMDDNSYHVVNQDNGNITATIDGFIIMAGSSAVNGYGAGMYVTSDNLTIANCVFRTNRASSGGGLFINNYSPIVSNCRFESNRAYSGGGLRGQSSAAVITDCVFNQNSADNAGGGIYCATSPLQLTRCTFVQNSSKGGGLYAYDCAPILTDCIFSDNYSHNLGGGVSLELSNPEFIGCVWIRNTAKFWGGGMYCGNSAPVVSDCTFDKNIALQYGGAVYVLYNSPTFTRCKFRGNSATTGAGIYLDNAGYLDYLWCRSPVFLSCLFAGNVTSGDGGGIYGHYSDFLLSNCVFSGNRTSSSGGGGGLYVYLYGEEDGCQFIKNSVFWRNADHYGTEHLQAQIFDNNLPQVSTITYSDIQGIWTGNGNNNIASDPLFIRNPDPGLDGQWGTDDDDYGDLRLQVGSPCIDAGNNTGVVEATDLDGKPRIMDGDDNGVDTVDMGAYEYYPLDDYDGDGVINGLDNCSNTIPGSPVDSYGCPPLIPGDFYRDGDVDQDDTTTFISCVSGPAIPHNDNQTCQQADFDTDNDVDQSDFGILQRCYSGEGNPADPNCGG